MKTTKNTHRNVRRAAAALATVAATTLAVGVTAGTASAMTNAQWRAACLNSGGEWDSFRSYGVLTFECIWVTGSGYSVDTYRGGRFVQNCGASRGGREFCMDI